MRRPAGDGGNSSRGHCKARLILQDTFHDKEMLLILKGALLGAVNTQCLVFPAQHE